MLMKKIYFLGLCLFVIFGISAAVAADETADSAVVNLIQISDESVQAGNADAIVDQIYTDEEISPQDLGNVKTGWFSGLVRNVKLWVTRDPIKKVRLELEKADVQLLKTKKLAKEKFNDPKFLSKFEKSDKKYAALVEKINARLEKIKQQKPDDSGTSKFLDTFIDHQLKHQQILERIGDRVSPAVRQRIESQRQRHLKRFGEVMNKLQTKEEFKKRIKNRLLDGNTKISQRIKHIKILENLEQVDPELKNKIEEIKRDNKQLWQDLKTKHQEIEDNRAELKQTIKEELQQAKPGELKNNPQVRQKILKNIRQKGVEVGKFNTINRLYKQAKEDVEKYKKKHNLGEVGSNQLDDRSLKPQRAIKARVKVNNLQPSQK